MTQSVEPSLALQAYRTIHDRIVRGELPQGSRLPEQRIAEELAVSRIPLREAIARLEVAGLVRTLPRKGAVVREWSAVEVGELFDVRLAVEVAAAGLAAGRIAAGTAPSLVEDALRHCESSLDSGDALRIADASTGFHESIVDLAGNQLLTTVMGQLTARIRWLFHLTASRDQTAACAEHRHLLDVLRTGNVRLAEATAYGHIEAGRRPSLAALTPDGRTDREPRPA